MRNALRAGVYFAGAVFLCAGALALPADTSGPTCSVQALHLEKPAYMVVDAVVRPVRFVDEESDVLRLGHWRWRAGVGLSFDVL